MEPITQRGRAVNLSSFLITRAALHDKLYVVRACSRQAFFLYFSEIRRTLSISEFGIRIVKGVTCNTNGALFISKINTLIDGDRQILF
ncbi:hypothetical protein KIN20_034634 [Parelaphostrongylus tenuis]|uniref:Uncharacterized protein n=1 Tax=Parelaphostrongylus tenuis TaxID=148309 RepID=A0AAD5R9Y4_PARTN|nr:hypothetical protein KIN20_034634 [Parelaphostrongylus tenuis]